MHAAGLKTRYKIGTLRSVILYRLQDCAASRRWDLPLSIVKSAELSRRIRVIAQKRRGASRWAPVPAQPAQPAAAVLPCRRHAHFIGRGQRRSQLYHGQYLRELGHQVVAVREAEEAIEPQLESQPFDTVMTDIRLPGMSGNRSGAGAG